MGAFAPSKVGPVGRVKLEVVRKDAWLPDILKAFNPRSRLGAYIKTILHYLPKEQALELIDRVKSMMVAESALYGVHIFGGEWRDRRDYSAIPTPQFNLGLLSRKVVTTAFVNLLVDWLDSTAVTDFDYHGIGVTNTAEAVGDTALAAELTTEYSPSNSTRATGTASQPSANIYQSDGTNTVDASVAIVEHGLFNNATVGSGTLMDRSVFSTVNLVSADSLRTIYQLTITAGG